jgi:type II secretion system protein N
MRILKKRALWYVSYGIAVSIVFLYLLFPADLVKNKIEAAALSQNIILKVGALRPSLPLGIRFNNFSVSSTDGRDVFFQGETIDLQAGLLSFLRKTSSVNFGGKAYGGDFTGHIGFASSTKTFPPADASLTFQKIDLGRYPLISNELGKAVSGKVKGSLSLTNSKESNARMAGSLTLFLVKGSYSLTEPFLGVSRIEIDHGEIRAQLKNGVLKLEKMEMFGPQINCLLKGEITLADDMKNSQLNLNGTMEILGKSKMKTNLTIGGTLANPVSRYI